MTKIIYEMKEEGEREGGVGGGARDCNQKWCLNERNAIKDAHVSSFCSCIFQVL